MIRLIDEYIEQAISEQATDIHLVSDNPPFFRLLSGLTRVTDKVICAQALMAWLEFYQLPLPAPLTTDDFLLMWRHRRLRGHLFYQHQGIAVALRVLADTIPTLQQLEAPILIQQILSASSQGLLVICGLTGSGKSTTLAAMVAQLSQQNHHVITLEDPIEYLYTTLNGLIQQRQIGLHCASYAQGIKEALRQDPDILVLGELRDKQEIQWALTAAQTGHLVLTTLHAADSQQAVSRLLNVFTPLERETLQRQLADVLVAIVAQRLVVIKQQRQAEFDILIANTAVKNLIRTGKLHQLATIIQSGQQRGM